MLRRYLRCLFVLNRLWQSKAWSITPHQIPKSSLSNQIFQYFFLFFVIILTSSYASAGVKMVWEECEGAADGTRCTDHNDMKGVCIDEICSHCEWKNIHEPLAGDCAVWTDIGSGTEGCGIEMLKDPGDVCLIEGISGECSDLGECIPYGACTVEGAKCNGPDESSKTCCPDPLGTHELVCVNTQMRVVDQCGKLTNYYGCAISGMEARGSWHVCYANRNCVTASGQNGKCGGPDCDCLPTYSPSPSPSPAPSSPAY